MIRVGDIELAEVVRILVELFPGQHKASATWMRTIGSQYAPASKQSDLPLIPRPRNDPGQRHPGRYGGRPTQFGSQERLRRPPQQLQAAVQSPLPAPPPIPSFAHELRTTEIEWRDKLPPGIEISWTEENSVRDRIAGLAGFGTWGRGYRTTMLTVKSAVTCEQGRVVSVEIVIPRIQDVKDVLMVVAPQHGTERIFEMQAGDISESHVRELGVFVLKSGGVR